MRPQPGEVLHFSEDPTITLFRPHVALTAQQPQPYVWAVGHRRAPDYWFPRQCPRVLVWAGPATTPADRDRFLGAGGGTRVHAVEYSWVPALLTVRLFAYRLPADRFRPFGDPGEPHAYVSEEPVEPLGPPAPVGDLLACHADAGIELRVFDSLWPFWDAVTASTAGFSGIRLRNARSRPSAG
jgi:hypothetical protein